MSYLALTRFAVHRFADLGQAWSLCKRLYSQKRFPAAQEVTAGVLWTSLGAFVFANLFILFISPRGRKLTLEIFESVLAVILVCILLAIVLGLPIGAVYLALKAFAWVVSSALSFSLIAAPIDYVRSWLGH
ncbi:hypothetical protein WJX72_010384 [[Myrmecia] bisecta]|uniref:Uncharacterized protein n=1 Tax=[Myrmecia] bisecta TaxID=41462 RepID=A0AAW1R9K2_9CHLO